MHRSLATLLISPLLACGSDPGDTTASTASETGLTEASTGGASTTGGTTSTGVTTVATTDDTTTDEPPTTSSSTTTDAPTTGGDSTTGGAAFCNGWQTSDGEPYLELHNKDLEPLQDGATLPLECGGQGLFMFGLYAEFGGFLPAGDIVDFSVVADVEGFNENPEGHFYSADPVGYYVGCQQLDGGPTGFVPVFPFDDLDDLTALDGKPASIQVVMKTGGTDVTVQFDVVLAVEKDDSWTFCGG